jgi:hypothetical protein
MRGKTGVFRACGVLAAVTTVAALAAGPAGAASAAPRTAAASTATASTAAGRLAAGQQPRDWAATLRPGQTHAASTAGPAQGVLSMTRQARAAAAASAATFSGAELAGVSCTGRKQCTATGLASTRTGKNYKPLAERWNGTTWTAQTTPTTNSGGYLGATLTAGVSCTSSSACMAAGFSYTATKSRLLGEGWNGRTWTIQSDSTPAVAGQPAGISCTWAKDCTAVGTRSSGMTLAEHWNGRHWSAVTTKHTGALTAASCPATGNCTAVGWNNAGKALAAHWNGKAWSDESPANPQPLSPLFGVSCPATSFCVAVGSGGTESASAYSMAPLAEKWTGGRWTALTVPDPYSSTDYAELNSVSCISATNCMAVGDDINAGGTTDATVAAQWNGTTWTILSTPSPATISALYSVSCTSATFCSAVGGGSPSPAGKVSPIAETWNGSTWSLQTAAG